jgi:hypothetical protein
MQTTQGPMKLPPIGAPPKSSGLPQLGSYNAPAAPAPAAAPPTFQPAAPAAPDPRIAQLQQQIQSPAAINPGEDARYTSLMDQLQQQIRTAQTGQDSLKARIGGLAGQQGPTPQSQQLNALLSQLMKGEGIQTAPLTNDPEAQAYRIAKTREGARAREAAANRQAAQGSVTGGGEFDARLAGIGEQTGEDIAGFEAQLTGKRRAEALDTAKSGASLTLADLQRQQQDRAAQLNALSVESNVGQGNTASLNALMNTLAAQQSDARGQQIQREGMNRQSDEALLATLLGEQGRTQDRASQSAAQSEQVRQERERLAREDALFKQQQEDRLRAQNSPARRGGMRLG